MSYFKPIAGILIISFVFTSGLNCQERALWGARITNDDWGTHPTIAYGVMISAAFFEKDVEKGGSIHVSILNSDGVQIATSEPITNSITDKSLKFDKVTKEETISLKIEIMQAKVYSFSIE